MVYLIWAEGTDHFKIGFSKKPTRRIREGSTFNPNEHPFRLLAIMRDGSKKEESFLHKCFQKYILRRRSEWFILPWLPPLLSLLPRIEIVNQLIIEDEDLKDDFGPGDYGVVEILDGMYGGLLGRYFEESEEEGKARIVLLEELVDQSTIDLPFSSIKLLSRE